MLDTNSALSRGLLARLFLGVALCLTVPFFLADNTVLRLATTTSTENSGLLQKLLPPFETHSGIRIHTIAVGTGKALRMGADGDVDILLVHAPAAETRFVADGHGVNRRSVMYNDFVIVGPRDDPAGINGTEDVAEVLRRIAQNRSLFVSRGDDSGTHKKERVLWQHSGIMPEGDWYREAGQGMGKVLQIAGELGAYTLTDRGTWLAYRSKSPLQILSQRDSRLFNLYGVIAVNPARYPDTNYMGAMALIAWLTSVDGQHIIRDYTVEGEALFVPTEVTQ